MWRSLPHTRIFLLCLLLLLLLLMCPLLLGCVVNFRSGIEAIYQFGDSLSDTGNLIREVLKGVLLPYATLPYGQTSFHRPTGRCSDGLLMVDYFAMFFNLPLVNPYLAKGSDFSHGVNFAVAGATALDAATLAAVNISLPLTTSSLSIQLGWFKSHLHSICANPTECKVKLEKALVIMGEVGGNDYNFALEEGKTMEKAYDIVPAVIQTIKDAVNEVIKLGAVNVVVPGNFPVGCVPLYLTLFGTNDTSMYDELQCLKGYNDFAKFHNDRLRQAIQELQQDHPGVAIMYGDYYSALQWLLRHASSLGFEKDGTQKACCGLGNNSYNVDFDLHHQCGNPGVPVCPDPSKRVSWDGTHLTQNAYKYVATWLLRHNIVPALHQPPLLSV